MSGRHRLRVHCVFSSQFKLCLRFSDYKGRLLQILIQKTQIQTVPQASRDSSKPSPLLQCLYFANIRFFHAFLNPEIFPPLILSIDPPPSFSVLSSRSNPLENHVFRGLKGRVRHYLSKGQGKSAYNNILRKQKASKKMNYCFDIQPTHLSAQTSHECPLVAATSCQKDCIFAVIKCRKTRAKQSSLSWTKTEERKYIGFLRNNAELFGLTAKERKDIKINVLISSAVCSRTPAQCHSHHQKMMLKHGNIQAIIDRLTDYVLNKIRSETHIRKEERPKNTEEKAHSEGTMQAEREIQLSTPEEKAQAQPAWWQYLNLMDDRQEEGLQFPWNQQPFFF